MLALEALNRLDHGLVSHVGRVRLQRRRLDGPLNAQALNEPFHARGRREGVEVAITTLEHCRRAAHALPREQGALQPELAGASEMKPLGVAAAPRELQEAGARRARDTQRV